MTKRTDRTNVEVLKDILLNVNAIYGPQKLEVGMLAMLFEAAEDLDRVDDFFRKREKKKEKTK